MNYINKGSWKTGPQEITDEIAFRISLVMNEYGRLNSNRVTSGLEGFFENEMSVDRIEAQPYSMVDLVVYAYGYKEHPTSIPEI